MEGPIYLRGCVHTLIKISFIGVTFPALPTAREEDGRGKRAKVDDM